ncbi:MAG: rhamnulokinase [Kiritimatiellae bacterium]|nr:rhamnulokinase [Kiritimatiellia bacterium]MDD5520975.1 rhamnulokinase [Kiritimatiellia bacterium]
MSVTRLFAVDFGASGGKCFAGTFEGKSFSMREVHRFAHEGVSFFIPEKKGRITERSHWNDILLYRNIVLGLQAYRRDVSDKLDSIGIDTWGADGQFINENGEMLSKIYCYRDHRLDNMIEVVKRRIDARRMYSITGIHFQPFNISNQLHWFVKNRKDLLRSVSVFLPIPSVFNYYLCGSTAVDSSFASVTQLMDAKKVQWSKEILKKLDIPFSVMPKIVKPGVVLGRLHKQLADVTGLNCAKVIAVAAHDTASAFAAAPVRNTDEALIISSGTWSLVGKLVARPITSESAMAANISNEGGIGNTRLLKNCMGSWLVQELRRIWRIADGKEMEWKELDRLTESAGALTAFIDPDDRSFYNPSNMETAIMDFCKKTGQPVPPNRGAFMRVVYESLALKYRRINEQICSVCGNESRVVHIVGGGSKNVMLNQFVADAMGLPVVAGPEEGTAVGNLMVQAMGLGIIKSMKEALPIIKQAFPLKEYTPRDTVSWNKAYERFRKIVA